MKTAITEKTQNNETGDQVPGYIWCVRKSFWIGKDACISFQTKNRCPKCVYKIKKVSAAKPIGKRKKVKKTEMAKGVKNIKKKITKKKITKKKITKKKITKKKITKKKV